MKLIHLPTGKEVNSNERIKKMINANPCGIFIRATLPEHWRVEMYDQSLEWARACSDDFSDDLYWITNYDFSYSGYKVDGFCSNTEGMQLPQISRAEFEYHIYNKWKPEQIKFEPIHVVDKWTNRIQIGKPYTSCIETNATKKSECEPTKPRIDYEKANFDYLQALAESMGYELVKKERAEIEWETEHNAFKLIDSGLWITDGDDDEKVFLPNAELDTLIQKYNQFYATPTT